ncbi:MAG: hypothetical protein K6E68_07335 [Lachnospiraceae bacterium]|nr:hypothetical protein [Lachnospiraceae bacterium]
MLNRMKKVLAVTLAATTILGTSLTAFATTQAASSSSSSTAETPAVASSTVGGVKSTTRGVNYATAVTGSAVTTPAATISAAFGLAANEAPFTKFYNFDPKKSKDANKVINDVVALIPGAVRGPSVNMEFGKMAGGKYSLLPATGAVTVSFGLPAAFSKNAKNVAVISVSELGLALLPDLDVNPYTVTVNAPSGKSVGTIIKY